MGGTEGSWCWVRGLRRWCPCACRGGTCHPHHGSPALPAAPAGAPCPGRHPQPHGALPALPWPVGDSLALHAGGFQEQSLHPPGVWWGFRLSQTGWGLSTGWEWRGWVMLVLCPRALQQGREFPVHRSCPKGRYHSQEILQRLSMKPKISPSRSSA